LGAVKQFFVNRIKKILTKGFLMKRQILFSAVVMLAGSLLAADSSLKDDMANAAKKLAETPNYSWKATVVVPEGAQFRPGPTEGKTEKDGFTWVSINYGDNTTQFILKGEKAAITKPDGGWQSLAEMDTEGMGGFMGRMVKNFKAPAAQAAELAAGTKELKKDGDVYSGDLTEAGAKAQFRFGTVNNPKGSVKFWLKDGVLTKYEFKVQGKVTFNDNEMDIDRATTVETKDVGTTKVTVPDEAKKKLS
jgi:hypothetical protein